MYPRFSLVLSITHACNLRCSYCYAGRKFSQSMSLDVARSALARAVESTSPGGRLDLGFFGGEPLLQAHCILDVVGRAREACSQRGIELRLSLTTNGTLSSGSAWRVMMLPEMEVALSHDGLPEVHDRYRRDRQGHGTSDRVLATLGKLVASGRTFSVVMVVRPDTVRLLPQGIAFLRDHGVRFVEPSLDLWSAWNHEAGEELRRVIAACADLWAMGLPRFGIAWFDDKAARAARLPIDKCSRCGFGDGEVAVAASGNLYPCERLIGEDPPAHALRLPGSALSAGPFVFNKPAEQHSPACTNCGIQAICQTTCRCANYVRTGDIRRPDGLLCLLDRVCYEETMRVLLGRASEATSAPALIEGGV